MKNKGSGNSRDSPIIGTRSPRIIKKGSMQMHKNTDVFGLCEQLKRACECIQSVNGTMTDNQFNEDDLKEIYLEMMVDELKHVQLLALKLTEMITEQKEAHADEMFTAGELNSVIGMEKPEEEEDDE